MASAARKAPARAARTGAPRARRVLDVTVVLLDGGYASTAVAPIEVFHSAGVLWNWLHRESPEPRFRVRTASLDGRSVTCLGGLGLTPQCSIHDIVDTDIVILPASGWDQLDEIVRDSPLIPWLRKWHERGAYIAGICTGVAFLAEAGVLDGRRATSHWAMADVLRGRYPKVQWRTEHFVTEDGPVFCSGGVYASIDVSLYLVEKLCGRDVALQCAKSLLVSMPRGRQSGYSVLPLTRPHFDDRIRKVETYLHEHYDQALSIDALAARIGMSPRNFIRRFKAATGQVPGTYVQLLRIAAAKEMLERESISIQSICTRVGYEDQTFFRALFKRHTGMTPSEYQARFAGMSFERGEIDGQRAAAQSA